MLQAADFAAATSRPIELRLRADLTIVRQQYQGRDAWLVKDPLRRKYFRFEEEEWWLLRQLDGQTSLHDMQQGFERRFAPQKISTREIHRLAGHAHRSGLVISSGAGQGCALLDRRREAESKRRWSLWQELLSIRFRGIDPDRALVALNRGCGWLFSAPVVFIGCLFGIAALLLLGSHWQECYARLPASASFFGSSNWLPLVATLALLKVLHELGHGIACKRFGGECHEMGLLLLCFTPCLYCDVTDSWTLPNKWQRAAIAAAGMYVELWLATIATFVWWFSELGTVHYLALNVMFVGSVSTLVFNANPLMRYDGYYILADLVEIPNLRSKATAYWSAGVRKFLLGITPPHDPLLPARHRVLLATYAVASAIYRWGVTCSIFWFLYRFTEPYGFKIVGQLLATGGLVSLVGVPIYMLGKSLHRLRSEQRTMNVSQAVFRCSILSAVAIGVFCIPLPHYLRCPLKLQPSESARVFVDLPGQIQEVFVEPGDTVRQGQPLVKLRNIDLELAAAQVRTQCELQAGKLAALRQRSLKDDSAFAELAQAQESLVALREELARRTEQLERLTIVAPRDGVVLPAPARKTSHERHDQLPTWHGQPLEARNQAAWLEASEVVCIVGDPHAWEALVAIDGHDIDFVQAGQGVEVLPAQRPGNRMHSSITSVARREMQEMPAAMSSKAGGALISQTDSRGRESPQFVTYEASAPFNDASGNFAIDGGGIARIHVGYQTLAAKCWRELRRTFHFDL